MQYLLMIVWGNGIIFVNVSLKFSTRKICDTNKIWHNEQIIINDEVLIMFLFFFSVTPVKSISKVKIMYLISFLKKKIVNKKFSCRIPTYSNKELKTNLHKVYFSEHTLWSYLCKMKQYLNIYSWNRENIPKYLKKYFDCLLKINEIIKKFILY